MTAAGAARKAAGGNRASRQISPTGKSLPIYGIRVKPRNKKYFLLPEVKSGVYIWPSRPGQKGVGRRHGRWTGCGGRWFTTDDRGLSVRRKRVVLAPVAGVKLRKAQAAGRGDGGNKSSFSGESTAISRKAIAQGRPGVHRCPVCSCAAYLVLTAHGTAGAARTRSSLRPLFERAGSFQQSSGAMRRENAKLYFARRNDSASSGAMAGDP